MALVTEKKIAACVLGASAVGKTSMLTSIVYNTYNTSYEPTIQEEYNQKTVESNVVYNLTFYDTSGQSDYDNLNHVALVSSDCAVLCYSPYVPQTVDILKDEVAKVRKVSQEMPIVVVATKMDLKEDEATKKKLEGQQLITNKELKSLLKKEKISCFIEFSSKNKTSGKELMSSIIKYTSKYSVWKKKQH